MCAPLFLQEAVCLRWSSKPGRETSTLDLVTLRDRYGLCSWQVQQSQLLELLRTMNKVFILSTTNGLVHSVNYGPFEVSPRFPFCLQKLALSWVSQFSVFPLLSVQ